MFSVFSNPRRKVSLSGLVLALAAVLVLTACGTTPGSDSYPAPPQDKEAFAPQVDQADRTEESQPAQSLYNQSLLAVNPEDSSLLVNFQGPEGRMISYSYSLSFETQDYSADYARLDQAIRKQGGYIASSDLTIHQTYEKPLHSAYFSVKIPQDKAADFLAEITDSLGTLTSQSSNSQDYTDQYQDTQIRLESEQKKLEALNKLYDKAENMEDIMAIQAQIIDCQSRIDQLEASQKQIEGLTNYASFDIQLEEVFVLTEAEREDPSFASQLGVAFDNSLKNISSFFQGLVLFLALAWPFILLLLAVIWLLVGLSRRIRHNREKGPKAGKSLKVKKTKKANKNKQAIVAPPAKPYSESPELRK